MKKNRKLKRPTKLHERRSVIFLAMEGTRTEPQYFDAIHSFGKLKSFNFQAVQKGGNPDALLKKIREIESSMEEHDFAWLVCDRDEWDKKVLTQIQTWSESNERNAFLFSNPSFDLWLLLHFSNWPSHRDQNHIEDFLGRHIADYKKHKHVPVNSITTQRILNAIQCASHHPHVASDLMLQPGTTVGEILKEFFD